MINPEKVIGIYLEKRFSRRRIHSLESIKKIVDECCRNLDMQVPTMVYYESINKDFFYTKINKKPYLFFDGGLVELLYIYNTIVLSGNKSDVEKLFFKLYGEEFLIKEDLYHAFYFTKMYESIEYSFENNFGKNNTDLIHLSVQIYYLIEHELAHLSLTPQYNKRIPENFRRFVRAFLAEDAKMQANENKIIVEVLRERAGYFVSELPKDEFEYFEMLNESDSFDLFVEECYCDYTGFKLLMENYDNASMSIDAIISAHDCEMTLQFIRDNISEEIFKGIPKTHNVEWTTMISFLRSKFLLCMLKANNLDTVIVNQKAIKRSFITDNLMQFNKKIPYFDYSNYSLKEETNYMNNKEIKNDIVKRLYYMTIGDDFYSN